MVRIDLSNETRRNALSFFKENLKSRGGLLTFVAILLWQLPMLSKGFATIDVGYHLTNQLMVAEKGVESVLYMPFDWLSAAIGGAWLLLVNPIDLGLYGARLGGAALVAATGSLATITVTNAFGRHWLVPLSVIAASFHIESSHFFLVNYTTVPAFLGVVFSCFYISLIRESALNMRSILLAIGTGIVMSLLIFAKLTFVTILLIPVVGYFLRFWLDDTRRIVQFLLLALAAFSCLFIVFLYLVGLWSLDYINTFFDLITGQGKTHGVHRILSTIPSSWWIWSPVLGGALIVCYGVAVHDKGKKILTAWITRLIKLWKPGLTKLWKLSLTKLLSVRCQLIAFAVLLALGLVLVLYNFEDCGLTFDISNKKCLRWNHYISFSMALCLALGAIRCVSWACRRNWDVAGNAAQSLKIGNKHHVPIALTVLLTALIAIVFLYIILSWEWVSLLVLGWMATCAFLFTMPQAGTMNRQCDLVVMAWAALALPFVNGLGSNTGLYKMSYGLWLIAALLPILLREIVSTPRLVGLTAPANIALLGFSLLFAAYGWQHAYRNVLGEESGWSELEFELKSPRLSNIHTTAGRRESFDSLIDAVQSVTSSGDKILAYNYLSMVHFSADTRPLYPVGWSVLNGIAAIEYSALENTLCVTKFPKAIVRTLTMTFSNNWGLNPETEIYDSRFQAEYDYAYDVVDRAMWNNCNPVVFWENPDFQVLLPDVSVEQPKVLP